VKLQKRERTAVYVLMAVIVGTAVYRLFLQDKAGEMWSLRASVPRKEKVLAEVLRYAKFYQRKQNETNMLRARLEARGSGFDPFVFLKNAAASVQLKDRHTIKLQRFRQSKESEFEWRAWNVKLTGVSQTEIGEFLHEVYAANKLLLVYEFTIVPERNIDGLSADIQIVTLFLK